MTEQEKQFIEEQLKHNRIVIQTVDGLVPFNIEDLVNQPVDGLLYDLNRDEATTYALNNERAINDIAVAKVIRYLYNSNNAKPFKNSHDLKK